jgi:hypothetical protein
MFFYSTIYKVEYVKKQKRRKGRRVQHILPPPSCGGLTDPNNHDTYQTLPTLHRGNNTTYHSTTDEVIEASSAGGVRHV